MAKDAGIRGDERKNIYKQSLAKENFSKLKVHLGNQINILILKIKMIPLIGKVKCAGTPEVVLCRVQGVQMDH